MATDTPSPSTSTRRKTLLRVALLLWAGALGVLTFAALPGSSDETHAGSGRQLTELRALPRMEALSLRGAWQPKPARMESIPTIGSQYTQPIKPKTKNLVMEAHESKTPDEAREATPRLVRARMESIPTIGSQYTQPIKPKTKNAVAARMEATQNALHIHA